MILAKEKEEEAKKAKPLTEAEGRKRKKRSEGVKKDSQTRTIHYWEDRVQQEMP